MELGDHPAEQRVIEVFLSRVPADARRRENAAAEPIRRGLDGSRAVVRHPKRQSIGMALLAGGRFSAIAAQQRHCPSQCFQIVAPSAAGARVDPQPGISAEQFVPVGQVAGGVPVFGNALPVRAVGAAPVTERVDVEILPVDVHALALNQAVDAIDNPLPGVAVAEVHQAAAAAAENPLGMVFGEPRARPGPLGLEPQHKSHPVDMGEVGNLANSLRKPFLVDFPRSRVRPPVPLARIPAGVDEIEPQRDLFAKIAVQYRHFRIGAGMKVIAPARAVVRRHELAAGSWDVVSDHPSPPEVLSSNPVAAIELQRHQRRPHFFAGMELEVRELLAGANPQGLVVVAIESRRPLAGPTQRDDKTFAGGLEVPIRGGAVGRPATRGRDLFRSLRAEPF